MKTDKYLRSVAEGLEEDLPHIYGERMGFFLVVFPFGERDRASDYISNAEREGAISALRETADRLEKNQVIPITIGEA